MSPGEATTAVLDAWERGDAQAVAALFAPDGRYEDPLFPEPLVGPAAIHNAVAPAMAGLDEVQIPVTTVVESGDTAICEARFLAMTVVVRDGKITRLTEYFDTRGLQP